jgi:hypothetical protein
VVVDVICDAHPDISVLHPAPECRQRRRYERDDIARIADAKVVRLAVTALALQ